MPAITVAIPTYNRLALLRETLATVLSQEDVDLEVIVIDNASDDGTPEAVEALGDPRVTVVRQPRNVGIIGNLNSALGAGTAPLLMVLHDDDLLRPRSLATRQALLEAHPSMVVAWSFYGVIDGEGTRRAECFVPHIPSRAIEDTLAVLDASTHGIVRIHMSAALIRRSLLGDVRCHEADHSFVDLGLWMRLAPKGTFGLVPLPLSDIRVHVSAGSTMGNFTVDGSGVIVPNAVDQVVKTIGVARRVLSDPSIAVPRRRRLRATAEWRGATRMASSLASDLSFGPANGRDRIRAAVRGQPLVLCVPLFWRVLLAHLRGRVSHRA